MRKLRLKFIAIAYIAIAFTFFTQSTQAYYSSVGTATNVVTSGDIQFMIHETTDQGTEFPKEGVYIIPGDIVSKKVSVENICTHPFYLRVKIVYGVDAQELSAEDCFKLNIDENNWKYHDGWYYYTGIVEPNQTTPDVFSKVEIVGSKVDNSYLGKTLSLSVIAHVVQSENNPIEGADTFTASGWPQE